MKFINVAQCRTLKLSALVCEKFARGLWRRSLMMLDLSSLCLIASCIGVSPSLSWKYFLFIITVLKSLLTCEKIDEKIKNKPEMLYSYRNVNHSFSSTTVFLRTFNDGSALPLIRSLTHSGLFTPTAMWRGVCFRLFTTFTLTLCFNSTSTASGSFL